MCVTGIPQVTQPLLYVNDLVHRYNAVSTITNHIINFWLSSLTHHTFLVAVVAVLAVLLPLEVGVLPGSLGRQEGRRARTAAAAAAEVRPEKKVEEEAKLSWNFRFLAGSRQTMSVSQKFG